jgi:ketosteroid isomerase-like protein
LAFLPRIGDDSKNLRVVLCLVAGVQHFTGFAPAGSIPNMYRLSSFGLVLCAAIALPLAAQTGPGPASAAPGFDALAKPSANTISPLTEPTLSPGVLMLLELDGKFEKAVAVGGGKTFASWFADDAVTLNNGRPPVMGRAAIAAQAQWDPATYQLTWTPQGAQMGPSNDMGFTWGHYEGHSKDKNGQPVVISGRYFTVWKKVADGSWKVAMDASADEPPAAGECCVLPKP